jgi:hypothetical protein
LVYTYLHNEILSIEEEKDNNNHYEDKYKPKSFTNLLFGSPNKLQNKAIINENKFTHKSSLLKKAYRGCLNLNIKNSISKTVDNINTETINKLIKS